MQQSLATPEAEEADAPHCALPSRAHRRAAGRDFTAMAVADFDPHELANVVVFPERVLNDPSATVVKRGRSAVVVRATVSLNAVDTPIAYKRCGARNWIRRLLRGLRTSAARRNFVLGHRLLELGVATPRPLLAVVPRWHNLLAPSYLATEWIEGAAPIDAFARNVAQWPPKLSRRILGETARQLGRSIATLHRQGYSHRDLKSANLLIRANQAHVDVCLIDLDGAARARFQVARARMKNILRLHAATSRTLGVTHSLRCRFLRSYLAVLTNSEDWKTLWRRLQKASRIPPARRPD